MNLSIDFAAIGIRLLQSLPYIFGIVVLPMVYNLLFHLVQPVAERVFDSRWEGEALKARNDASGVNRAGAYLGIVLALALSQLGSNGKGYWLSYGNFVASALITIVTFMIAHHILDRVVVRRVDNSGLVSQGNMAVALTESAAYVSIGLVIGGSFAGGGDSSFWSGIGNALLFSVLGTAVLMAFYTVYTLAWKRFRVDVDARIGEKPAGHIPSAIDAGSVLIAVAFTLFFSIAGDTTGWIDDIVHFFVAVAASTVLVPAGRFVAGKLDSVFDRQSSELGRSLLIGVITIGIGLMAALAI